ALPIYPWPQWPNVFRVASLAALLMGARYTKDVGPLRPRIVGRPPVRRPRKQLELVNRECALAVDGAEAVGAGVAAADDDHALARRRDELIVGNRVALAPPVLERQVLHREVYARELAPRHGEVARVARAAREH